jgi:hypothetical protein
MHFTRNLGCRRIVTTVLITGLLSLAFTSSANGQKFRYFGTNLSDWAVLTSPTGGGALRWRMLKNENPSTTGTLVDIPFGLSTDLVTNQGNWRGDAAHDLSVYRGSTYFISEVMGGANTIFNWGSSTTDYIGSEGDYDGDQKMDYTVVRAPTTASPLQWWVLRSSDSTARTFAFGTNATDLALPGADYTGDGLDDPAIARIGAGGQLTWWIGTTTGASVMVRTWGNFNSDFIVPGGDYDGDAKADFMVWRGLGDGVWYLMTNAGATSYLPFGIAGSTNRDRALRAGDYDGDGKTDIAIYRPSTLTFWVNRSTGGVQTQTWGVPGNNNLPVAAYGIF